MTDRPLGAVLAGWHPPARPATDLALTGHHAHMRPLDPVGDAPALFVQLGPHPLLYDYLFEPPPATVDDLRAILLAIAAQDVRLFAICRAGRTDPLGYACLMNINTAAGDIEIGNVNLSPVLQKTPVATEAFYLMCDWAFTAGYRRVVWKCNALNAPSRSAAQRLGFSYEGVFRNHLIVKGRNRDTAWFAMTDGDWTGLSRAYDEWLTPANFDAQGRQRSRLGPMTAPYRVTSDPALSAPLEPGSGF
ncbi:GNAT family protein [Loktanella sp. SALINAS62]|uniref:GNAT family N-acetyltransferase n=1 Tax=Loktanella sp. SALINAS62 TaxID=2706124 RepID=UPI001B8C036B|nr:GNAT family protein [Loktanella sp. SALINAS62]MBS1304002.1 GNAT family N-acetyltransferase [Loktanella sp. SALINAS62]